MRETIHGIITRVYHNCPNFSAGLLEADDGQRVRFTGKFYVTEGDVIGLVGTWTPNGKYGTQFVATAVNHDVPESVDGLINYLAKHPGFAGIGEARARQLVTYAGSAQALDGLIRNSADELQTNLHIPAAALSRLRTTWMANASENEVRSYLAGFGLTNHQINALVGVYGESVVSVIRADPYRLIQHLKAFGFKKVDKIARATGIPKDHPGRIEAGLIHCHCEQAANGHTWTASGDLVNQANDLLVLDTLDAQQQIHHAGLRLLDRGDLVAEGVAVTTPAYLDAERTIHSSLHRYGAAVSPLMATAVDVSQLSPRQAEALRQALRYRICVISGPAGTGKTFVVARIAQTCVASGLTVRLCAPTGKAAKRIEESLRKTCGLEFEASTIHRMLKYDGKHFGVDILEADIVIVDEMSMVDVTLMADLIRRLNLDHTRLILVGDHNQLPPVGPGNVLRDIVNHRPVPTVVLDEVFRQAGALKRNCERILRGEIRSTEHDENTHWIVVDKFSRPQDIQVYLRDLVLDHLPSQFRYDAVRDVQIITPTHKGPLGTIVVNEAMQMLLTGRSEKAFLVGDKVIQTSNDYDLEVMNGTIGFVVDVAKAGCTIAFDGIGPRVVTGKRLSNVRLAYVLTAHKAQGSEFRCVVVLCHKSHFFADRNWLYTAVTRASETCVLLGDHWGLRQAAKKNRVINRRTFMSRWASNNGKTAQEVACA